MRYMCVKKNAQCARRMAAPSISGSAPAFLQFTQEPTEKPLKEDLASPKSFSSHLILAISFCDNVT